MSDTYKREHIDLLCDLQEIDREIDCCREAELARDRRLLKLTVALQAANAVLLDLTAGSDRAAALYLQRTGDVAAVMQRKNRANEMLLASKNAKEAANLQKEVESLERRITDYADKLSEAEKTKLVYADRLQQINTRIVEIKNEMQKLEGEKNNSEIAMRFTNLSAKRRDILEGIPDSLAQMYNHRKNNLGYAVARLEGNTCGGCCLTLTCADEQKWREKADPAFFCPSCDCFLV